MATVADSRTDETTVILTDIVADNADAEVVHTPEVAPNLNSKKDTVVAVEGDTSQENITPTTDSQDESPSKKLKVEGKDESSQEEDVKEGEECKENTPAEEEPTKEDAEAPNVDDEKDNEDEEKNKEEKQDDST